MILVYLTALVAAVSGAAIQQCCGPSKYSAVMLHVGGSHKGSDAKIEDNVLEIQFDYDTKMMVIVAHSLNTTGNTLDRTTTTLRYDYAFSTNYITTEDGKCYKQALDPNGMSDRCIPASVHPWGHANFGVGMEAIPVYGFSGNVNDTYGNTGRLSITVTADGECVPVSMFQYGEANGVRSVNAYLFTDVVQSINPSAFNIPRNCATATTIPSTKRSLEALTGIRHPF